MVVNETTGYLANEFPIHEGQDDLKRRMRIVKKVIHTCSCTSGCRSLQPGVPSRCVCRIQNPPMFFFLCKCGPNCENRGDVVNERVNVFGCGTNFALSKENSNMPESRAGQMALSLECVTGNDKSLSRTADVPEIKELKFPNYIDEDGDTQDEMLFQQEEEVQAISKGDMDLEEDYFVD